MINHNNDKELRDKMLLIYKNLNYKTGNKKEKFDDYINIDLNSNICADDLIVNIKTDKNQNIIDIKYSGNACIIATVSSEIFCNLIIKNNKETISKIINDYYVFLSTGILTDNLLNTDLIIFKN